MIVALIASVARDGAIGRRNGLVWHEREDQRHFRDATMGHPVVMGRKTWESLPEKFRPLPGRRNVVVTRQPGYAAPGAECVAGLEQAWSLLAASERVFVIGGAPLFAQALPRADELVLTEIDAVFPDADAHFPAWDRSAFRVAAARSAVTADGVPYRIATYRRTAQS